ncbi:MAG TPA: pitrilysin family protein [Thermoanaerobaculia bacterium]|nr:pitrilysin family protein [Thermoanaerobaculia bacterium]
MSEFRSTPPLPTPPRPYRFPPVRREVLENGLRILVAVRSEAPLMTVRMVVRAGAAHDPLDQPGIAIFTAEMLEEGAAGRGSMEMAEHVGDLGAALYCGADWDGSVISIDALGRHLEDVMRIVADLALRPDFPQNELERLRDERISAIRQQRDDPASVAGKLFNRFVFGSGVYANPAVGTESSVASFSRGDAESFYGRHYAPNNASLLITGAVDPDEVISLAREIFGSWVPREQAVHEPPAGPPLPDARIYLVDRPSAVQSEIRIGHSGVPRSSEDYFPLLVMNGILGGVFTSRLNLNLRERHGYTYGIRSSFSFRREGGPFVVSTAVRNDVTSASVREILTELAAIREGELTSEELAVARDYMEGVFPATVETAHDLAARLQEIELYGLPENYFDHYRERIAAVSTTDVRRVAQKYLDPSRIAIVVVGRVEEIDAPLRALEHPVGLYDIEGKPLVARS